MSLKICPIQEICKNYKSEGRKPPNNDVRDKIPLYKEGFDINWGVTRSELSQAIPPAYTEYIGKYLMSAVKQRVI